MSTGNWRNDWIDVLAATCDAISTNAFAPADSGRETTTGTPLSASSRIVSSSGIAPRRPDDQRFQTSVKDLYGKVYPAVLEAIGNDPKRDQQIASDAEAALRECLEETGYRARNPISLGVVNPNPTLFANRLYAYLATDVVPGQRAEDSLDVPVLACQAVHRGPPPRLLTECSVYA